LLQQALPLYPFLLLALVAVFSNMDLPKAAGVVENYVI
jgi:hypothetical protein